MEAESGRVEGTVAEAHHSQVQHLLHRQISCPRTQYGTHLNLVFPYATVGLTVRLFARLLLLPSSMVCLYRFIDNREGRGNELFLCWGTQGYKKETFDESCVRNRGNLAGTCRVREHKTESSCV